MSVEEMLAEAKRKEADRQLAGFDQAALDTAARLGFGNGAFEDSEEEGGAVVEEFFTAGEVAENLEASSTASSKPLSLAERLGEKVAAVNSEKSA